MNIIHDQSLNWVKLTAILWILALAERGFAQSPVIDTLSYKPFVAQDLYQVPWQDYLYAARSLGHFSEKEWRGLFIVGTTTAQFMLFFDRPVDQWIKKRPRSVAGVVWRDIARIGHTYDDITPDYMTAALVGANLSIGLIRDDDYFVRTATMILEAHLLTSFATALMKHSFGRHRPYVSDDPLVFDPFTFDEIRAYIDFPRGKDPRNAFPSGHTSSIFTMMTVIANRYDVWYVKIPAYTYAVSVGVNRMNNPSHWGSDVIFGAMLGWYIGDKISDRGKPRKLESAVGVQIEPAIGAHGPGLRVRF